MKIFRNNVCFVNIKDLVGYDLPDDISFDKDAYEENDYVMFTEEKDINYIKKRDDILDYDFISLLSLDQLNTGIKRIEQQLEPYYKKLNECLKEERFLLYKDPSFKDNFFKLDKIYYDMIHYRNNKEQEDDKVNMLLSKYNVLKKVR